MSLLHDFSLYNLIEHSADIGRLAVYLLICIGAFILRRHEKTTGTFAMYVGAWLIISQWPISLYLIAYQETLRFQYYIFAHQFFTILGVMTFACGFFIYVLQRKDQLKRIGELESIIDDLHQR